MKDTLEIIDELIGDLEKVPAADRSPFYGGVLGALKTARDNATWELERLAALEPPKPGASAEPAPPSAPAARP